MEFKPFKDYMDIQTMDEVVFWEHTGKSADDVPIEEVNAFFVNYLDMVEIHGNQKKKKK